MDMMNGWLVELRNSFIFLLYKMQKKCGKCNQVKNLDEFYLDAKTKDCHRPYCKECFKRESKINHRKKKLRVLMEVSAPKIDLRFLKTMAILGAIWLLGIWVAIGYLIG